MEIHHHPSSRPDPAGRRSGELRTDLTRRNREGIERSLEIERAAKDEDRVVLSAAARSYSKDLATVAEETAEHRRKIAELIELQRSGNLNTPERVDRAAEGILGGPQDE